MVKDSWKASHEFMSNATETRREEGLCALKLSVIKVLSLVWRGSSERGLPAPVLCSSLDHGSKCLHSANKKKKLLSAAISIGEKIMNDAAKGIRQLKKCIHGTVNCGVSVDGTWQRRGFSSLNGCVSAISVDTGEIIDFETLSQFCRKCNSKTEQQNVKLQCTHHTGSSSSMEPVGAYRIFERSEDHRMLRYTDYYGDGDSKAFDAVKDNYGKDSVTKLECIGHIQKRVGTRLRKLKSRNKGLGGKGKLTDGLINKLQNYFGLLFEAILGIWTKCSLLLLLPSFIVAHQNICQNMGSALSEMKVGVNFNGLKLQILCTRINLWVCHKILLTR
ncbi:uncharacterized protein TNCV_1911901 [Trichonephila clavipes]|nr:uncharacterized protein TNCV_1911901 [Trichonephila clavipes]